MALAIGINQEQFTFRMVGAAQREDRIRITADWVLAQFEQFYTEFLEVPYRAKAAFEQQHHSTSIWLSRHRLSLYSSYIHRMGAYLKAIQPNISVDASFLNQLEDHFWRKIEHRYESDVASWCTATSGNQWNIRLSVSPRAATGTRSSCCGISRWRNRLMRD
jgi:hypothetical protein